MLEFDPKKPFRPLVLNYLCAIHGAMELISRSLTRKIHGFASVPRAVEHLAEGVDSKVFKARVPQFATGAVTTMFEDMSLFSKVGAPPIAPKVDSMAEQMLSEFDTSIERFITQAGGSLIITAWDITVAHHTRCPEWEFLRHCRNAAAHNGSFHFLHGEPRRPASWRGLVIEPKLDGYPLLRGPLAKCFLGPADPVILLHDLEQTI